MRQWRQTILGTWVALLGCDAAEDGGAPSRTASGPIPQGDRDALLRWLDGRGYLEWDAESSAHVSRGPHFGMVRAFVNEPLADALADGSTAHPVGSATVKELYADGVAVLGWSVSIKVRPESDLGAGWYWYEFFDGAVLADAEGLAVCTDCHAGGRDFVLTGYPLQ